MEMDLSEILRNVESYFKERLPQYAVLEVRRKSSHPDDGYLFMVSAQKDDGTYAVWTSWNESTQTLNYGHYGLESPKDCDRIFAEHQNTGRYFAVYRCSQNTRLRLFTADSEEQARKFCEENCWEWKDENDFVWSLDYRET